ncbi:hypothetical protein [uncultured Lamprocystis sp.]|jgi:hypothetical protein|uniref:hypothetical protein n=1 Tax=uncultured Lamprocystis sp. TaxID=543132 RepID=UPI0025E444C6|nr:hypothetical protein [uncultured Lamprocystis sp.]
MQPIVDYVSELCAAAGIDQCFEALERAVVRLGFDGIVYSSYLLRLHLTTHPRGVPTLLQLRLCRQVLVRLLGHPIDEDARDWFEERAAIMEYVGGLTREVAQAHARAETIEYMDQRRQPPGLPPGRGQRDGATAKTAIIVTTRGARPGACQDRISAAPLSRRRAS